MAALFEFLKDYCQRYIFAIVKTIGILDMVDILLLTLILYFVYRFIRDRRAGKLLIGVGVVLVLSLLGDVFDMPATKFLFGDFRQIGVIAVLILFQPEIRSVLEKVGGTPFSGIRNITSDSRDSSALNAEIESMWTSSMI